MNDKISSIRLQPKTKITIYEDIHFGGGSRTFMNNSNAQSLINLTTENWNDQASSYIVSEIAQTEFGVNVFENSHNRGNAIRHTSPRNQPDLRTVSMNDKISSIELYPNTKITVYEDVFYGGESTVYQNKANNVMVINLAGTKWNDRISSYISAAVN